MTYPVSQMSMAVPVAATSQKVSISGTAASSSVVNGKWVLFYASTDCFIRQGATATAVADGTDMFVPGLVPLRLEITSGNVISIITSGSTGSAYITPSV